MVQRSSVFAIAGALLLTGMTACGGGSGGGSALPGAVATQAPGSGGSNVTTGTATATFAVSLQQYAPVTASSGTRRAAFISPATASLSVKLASVNGTAQTGAATTYAVGPTAPNCGSVSGVVTCSLDTTLPIGDDTFTVSTLDGSAHTLGTSTMAATIVANSSNRIALAVGGTIASLEIFLSTHSFTPGPAANANVIVVPLDSSGAAIVNPGNYSVPITLTETNNAGATGHFSLVTDGTNTALASTINSPNDQVVLHYDGLGTSGSTTITAAAGTGVSHVSTSASFAAAGLSAAPSGAQFTTTSQYVFNAPGQTGTVNASGGTPPYTIASSDTSLATIGGTSPHFTVSSIGYGATGAGILTVTDNVGATSTVTVTYIAPALAIAVQSCGSGATCNTQSATYSVPVSGPSGALAPTTIAVTGGSGAYSYFFTSTGLTSSAVATVGQSGGALTITPSGFGNDALIITSGNRTAYYAVNASPNVFSQQLPAAIGMLLESAGKLYSATLPATVTGSTQLTGAADEAYTFSAIGPTITATPMTPGTGSFQFTSAFGNSTVPFTLFGISFASFQGGGFLSSSEQFVPSDEQFTATGQTDVVTVSGQGGTLTASSANTTVATVSVAGNHLNVTAIGSGFTTITITDSATGAHVSYTLSVTTTVIPIAARARQS